MDTEQFAQLDPDSFAMLFERARGTLRVVAAAECGFDLADDIVQHSAIVALERLDQFTAGTNFTAWSITIVRGVARNQRRSEQRRISKISRFSRQLPRLQPRKVQGGASGDSTQSPLGPDFELSTVFSKNLIGALDTLNPVQRTCLLLKTILDHSYKEIGEILDIPAATARSHVYRSRSLLLSILHTDPENQQKGAKHDESTRAP